MCVKASTTPRGHAHTTKLLILMYRLWGVWRCSPPSEEIESKLPCLFRIIWHFGVNVFNFLPRFLKFSPPCHLLDWTLWSICILLYMCFEPRRWATTVNSILVFVSYCDCISCFARCYVVYVVTWCVSRKVFGPWTFNVGANVCFPEVMAKRPRPSHRPIGSFQYLHQTFWGSMWNSFCFKVSLVRTGYTVFFFVGGHSRPKAHGPYCLG